jgi:hypothetical protein
MSIYIVKAGTVTGLAGFYGKKSEISSVPNVRPPADAKNTNGRFLGLDSFGMQAESVFGCYTHAPPYTFYKLDMLPNQIWTTSMGACRIPQMLT